MRTHQTFRVFILGACGLVLSGCLTPAQKIEKEKIADLKVTRSIPPAELAQYEQVNADSCDVSHYEYMVDMDDYCKKQLKTHAVAVGADLVVIDSIDHFQCKDDGKPLRDGCVRMGSRGFRKKAVH